jgi:hypothetical protein
MVPFGAALEPVALAPHPLTPPDPPHALDVDVPALRTQQRRDPAIAIAAILGCQRDDRCGQRCFVVASHWSATLRRAVLADHATGPTFRYVEANLHVVDRCLAACGA